MTAAAQRKKNRKRSFEKRRDEKLKKLRSGNKITTRSKKDGKLVKTDRYYGGNKISNTPKEGTRAGLLKMKGQGMGAGYKDSEKKAFDGAKKWQKSDEKKKITENKKKKDNGNKLKINKNKKTGGSSSSSGESKYIRTSKGTLAKRGTVSARKAENKEKARKRAQEAARKRLANK